MKNIKIYLFVLIIALSFNNVYSEVISQQLFMNSDTEEIKIFNIAPSQDSDLYITSNLGIFKSTDSGVSWTNINYNFENIFTQDTCFIYFIRIFTYNKETQVIVWGTDNYLYYLNQNMKTWSRYDFFKENNFIFEDIIEYHNKYIASTLDSGLFISDNLIDWEKSKDFYYKGFDHFFIHNDIIYLNNYEMQYTLKGDLIKRDYKKFFTPKNTAGYFAFDAGIMYVSSKSGIFLSSDEGESWLEITFNLSESLKRTYIFPVIFYDKFLYCCLDDGIYLFSKNNNSWVKIFPPDKNKKFLFWNMIKIKNSLFVISLKYGLFYSTDGINFKKSEINFNKLF